MRLVHVGRLYLLEDALARLADLQSRMGASGLSSGSQQEAKRLAPSRPAVRTGAATGASAREPWVRPTPAVTRPSAPVPRESTRQPVASQPSRSRASRDSDEV